MTRRLAVLLLALALLAVPVAADEHDEDPEGSAPPEGAASNATDPRPGLQAEQPVRDVHVTTGPAQVAYRLVPRDDPLRDTVHFDFDGRTGEMRFQYREERSRADTAFNVSLTLERLVEFRDGNGNHRYDPGSDRRVASHGVSGMSWNVTDPETVALEGADAEHVTARGFFEDGGELRLQFFVTGREADVAGVRVRPQDVKVTLDVARFPFREEDTQIALVLRFDVPGSTDLTRVGNVDDALTALRVDAPGRGAFLDWADHAVGNSTTDAPSERLVFAGVEEDVARGGDGAAHRLILTYPRADHVITHDAVFGVAYAPPAPPPFLGLPVGRLLGVAVVGFVAWSGWRWSRREDRTVTLAEWVRRRLKRLSR